MTRDELLKLAEKHAICTSEAHKEFLHDGLMAFAAEISAAERRKHQADIERWRAEAATAEKWRGLAMAREGANGRVIQEVQEESAAAEREACATMILETKEWRGHNWYSTLCDSTKKVIAKSIRARGAK